MLNLRILLSDDPFLSVDFFKEKSDLSLMLFLQAGSALDMNIAVFLLYILDLGFVHLFKLQNSFSQGIIFSNQVLEFAFVSIFQVSVFL